MERIVDFALARLHTSAQYQPIKEMLKIGWRLHGSPFIVDGFTWQAIYKTEEIDEAPGYLLLRSYAQDEDEFRSFTEGCWRCKEVDGYCDYCQSRLEQLNYRRVEALKAARLV